MKDFFKYVLATMVGIIGVGIFTMIMSVVMLIALVAATSSSPSVSDDTVLRINLNGTIQERATENPLAELFGNSALENQGLDDLKTAIAEAKTNRHIKGIYIEAGMLSTDYAIAQELRKALLNFKESKKFVVAYGDNYTQGAYYVASVADKVLLNPSGMLDWHGMASRPIFYKDLLEKIGVKMQIFRVGTYKSAVEPFMATEMSPANREQVTSFLTDIWSNIKKEVAASRRLSEATLDQYANQYVALTAPEQYIRMKLVDGLAYADQVRAELRQRIGNKAVRFISPAALAEIAQPTYTIGADEVAVYYASGEIVDVAAESNFSENDQIVGSKVVSDLDELANDDDVKAVVLRINSPGGSAYASEQMWRAVQLLKAKKPVVVSMSGVAASGGYYLACGADCIFAEPTTLTGSIGIFGIVPDVSGLLTEKLGLHFDVVKTNEASDFGAVGRSFNAAESAAMQAYVERGYRLFLSRVAAGRKMTPAQVDSIAQGRVWTGGQALRIRLVDRIGGLNEAIAEAAARAKMKAYSVASYPAPLPWYADFGSNLRDDYMERQLRRSLGEYYAPLQFVQGIEGRNRLQARVPFTLDLR